VVLGRELQARGGDVIARLSKSDGVWWLYQPHARSRWTFLGPITKRRARRALRELTKTTKDTTR